jgi:hypothetical protein
LTDIIINNQLSSLVAPTLTGLITNLRRRSMKLVKEFVFSVLLVSTFAVNTYAGDLETPGTPPPPSHSMCSTGTTEEATTVPCENTQTGEDTAEPCDEVLYETLIALLSLF